MRREEQPRSPGTDRRSVLPASRRSSSTDNARTLLGQAFSKALSELPKEKVLRAWSPLRDAFEKQKELHAEAVKQLDRLFPNRNVGRNVGSGAEAPDTTEEEPQPEHAHGDFEGDWDGVFDFGFRF